LIKVVPWRLHAAAEQPEMSCACKASCSRIAENVHNAFVVAQLKKIPTQNLDYITLFKRKSMKVVMIMQNPLKT